MACFIALAIFALSHFGEWQASFFESRTEWYWTWTGAELFATLLFFALFAVFCFLSFVTVGSLITSPFSDFLSHRVEAEMLPGREAIPGVGAWLARDALRSIKHECIRLAIYLGLLALCAPLLLIPFLGPPGFSVVMTYITIRYLAWDGLDYCLSRRRLRFRDKMTFLRERRMRTLGFGSFSFLLLAIPLTTLFVLPLNAIGGSILFCRIVRSDVHCLSDP